MTVAARPGRDGVEALERLGRAPHLLACFDYDGTLTPIRPTPEEAVLAPEMRRRLESLAALPGVDVAVVSGRPLAELRELVALPNVTYVGHHGLSLLPPGADEPRFRFDPEEARARLADVRSTGSRLAEEHPGVRLEDKGAMVALHTRQAEEAAKRVAGDAFREAAEGVHGFELLAGKEVLEVRPRGVDKGSALDPLLETLPPDAGVLYVGDDVTDEDAFRRLAADPRATTVLVGDREGTAAALRLPDTAAVADWIERLVGACRSSRRGGPEGDR